VEGTILVRMRIFLLFLDVMFTLGLLCVMECCLFEAVFWPWPVPFSGRRDGGPVVEAHRRWNGLRWRRRQQYRLMLPCLNLSLSSMLAHPASSSPSTHQMTDRLNNAAGRRESGLSRATRVIGKPARANGVCHESGQSSRLRSVPYTPNAGARCFVIIPATAVHIDTF
jgi:hypothetical protein